MKKEQIKTIIKRTLKTKAEGKKRHMTYKEKHVMNENYCWKQNKPESNETIF